MTPDEFAERFNRLRSSEDRYRYLIQLGRKLEPYPEEFRDQEHLVPGCLSQVWLGVPSMARDLGVGVPRRVGRNDPSEPQGPDREGRAERRG